VSKRRDRTRSLGELLGLVVVAIDLWHRLPRPVRRRLIRLARSHGLRLARRALAARRSVR